MSIMINTFKLPQKTAVWIQDQIRLRACARPAAVQAGLPCELRDLDDSESLKRQKKLTSTYHKILKKISKRDIGLPHFIRVLYMIDYYQI